MTGRHDTTYSPSSSRTSRSTPWVEGCCGPMLMIMVSSRTGWTLIAPSHPSLVGRRDEGALVLGGHPRQRVVLAQRMAHPSLGHLDPAEVGMPVEHHAEEVEDLPVVAVRRREHGGDRGDVWIVAGEADLHPDAVGALERLQVVGDPEPRLLAGPVGGREIGQEPEGQVLLVPKVPEGGGQLLGGDGDRDLAAS